MAVPPDRTQRLRKPRRALEIAVAGNRRFAGESDAEATTEADRTRATAAHACQLVWRVIVESMTAAFESEVILTGRATHGSHPQPLKLKDFFNGETPRLGVLSSLAAGADQIAAEAAFSVSGDLAEVELEAVLPFGEADYPGLPGAPRPEFRPAEAAALRALLDRALQVIRLDGRYDREDDQHRAYRQARDVLLHNGDALVAVYDPHAPGRAAGTIETVRLALDTGLPVFAVLVAPDEARIAVYSRPADRPPSPEREWGAGVPLDDDRWKRAVHERVLHLVALPDERPAPSERPDEAAERLRSLGETVERLQILFGDQRPPGVPPGGPRRWLYRLTWNGVLAAGRAASRRVPWLEREPPASPTPEVVVEPYAGLFERASVLAAAYMETYRGTFVLSFLFAGTAVAAAVALLAASLIAGGAPPLQLVVVLGGLKVGLIVTLLVIASASHRDRYQEHAADYRYLAELVRPMQSLAVVGTTIPFVELPAHSAPLDPRHGWTPWIFRAISRATSCVAVPGPSPAPRLVEFSAERARHALADASRGWVQGQIVYHWHNARRMHWIDDGLERLARGLLYVVLTSAATAIVLELLHVFHTAVIVLGSISAALPAFIAALSGIMFQSEAKRLRLRSEAMFHGLAKHQLALEAERASLEGPRDSRGGETWLVALRLRSIAAMVIQETGDWKVLDETHEVHAG